MAALPPAVMINEFRNIGRITFTALKTKVSLPDFIISQMSENLGSTSFNVIELVFLLKNGRDNSTSLTTDDKDVASPIPNNPKPRLTARKSKTASDIRQPMAERRTYLPFPSSCITCETTPDTKNDGRPIASPRIYKVVPSSKSMPSPRAPNSIAIGLVKTKNMIISTIDTASMVVTALLKYLFRVFLPPEPRLLELNAMSPVPRQVHKALDIVKKGLDSPTADIPVDPRKWLVTRPSINEAPYLQGKIMLMF